MPPCAALAAEHEPADMNPIAARAKIDAQWMAQSGIDANTAMRRATYRVFGSKPGRLRRGAASVD